VHNITVLCVARCARLTIFKKRPGGSQFFPAPLLHHIKDSKDQVSRPWSEGCQGSLGKKGQQVYLVVRTGCFDAGTTYAGWARTAHMGITNNSLWRIVFHYVDKAMKGLDLSFVHRIAVDETASGKWHRYVTVFMDLDRGKRSVIFATPGKDKETISAFCHYLKSHGGCPSN